MNDHHTPIHNEVLEALAKINLAPYETRVLFIIWRKTYGFVDSKTGERKKYDWIAGSQISKMTGLDRRHVSRALKGLKNKHVISRDDKKTGFSKEFMKLMSSVEMTVISRDDKLSSVEMTPTPSRDDKLSSVEAHTKEIKETNTKESINSIIPFFEVINPSYKRFYSNKTERTSLERLVKQYGYERVISMVKKLPDIMKMPYAPPITSPYELEVKMGKLKIFLEQEKNKGSQLKATTIKI